jgi:hypothetical protein
MGTPSGKIAVLASIACSGRDRQGTPGRDEVIVLDSGTDGQVLPPFPKIIGYTTFVGLWLGLRG